MITVPDFDNVRDAGIYGPFGPEGTFPRYGIYVRTSTEKQMKENWSGGTQVDLALSHLNRKFGDGRYQYIVYMEDESAKLAAVLPGGARRRGRRILGQLMKDAEDKKLDGVAFLHQDRLSREVPHTYAIVDKLRACGCKLEFLQQQSMDLDTPEGRLQFGYTAVQGEAELMQLSRRVSAGVQKRARDGYWVGNPPWPWKREGKMNVGIGQRPSLVIGNKHGKEVISLIYELISSGKGPWFIIRELARRGMPSPTGLPTWSCRTLMVHLRTPCHSGQILVDGKLETAAHFDQRIVQPEDYERLQQILENRKKAGPSTHCCTNNLLGLIARCGHCGRRLYLVTPSEGSTYYRCFSKKPTDDHTCPGFMAKAEKVERAMYREIRELAETTQVQQAAEAEIEHMVSHRESELSRELSRLERNLAAIPAKREALLRQFMDADEDDQPVDVAQYERLIAAQEAELSSRISVVRPEVADHAAQRERARVARATLADFPRVWDSLEIEEKRELLANLVESLSFTREGRDVVMRLKLIFREEKEIVIPPDKRAPTEKTGVRSLTQRQLAILDLLSEGHSRREIARRLGIEETAVNSHLWFVRRQLGVAAIEEAIRLAWPRIEAERQFLPKEGRSRPPMTRGGKLSPREIELLRRLAAGESLCGIARSEGRALGSLSTRLRSAKRKLGVKTREEAIGRARETGLI